MSSLTDRLRILPLTLSPNDLGRLGVAMTGLSSLLSLTFASWYCVVRGILEVVSNPWRFILGNWFCDSDLDNPTGIDRVLTEKDLLANLYSDLEASILDEKEFLLLKVISTLLNLSCLICSIVGAGLGTDDVALSMTHFSERVTSSHFMVLGRETLAFVISMINKEYTVCPEGFLGYSSHPYFDLSPRIELLHQRDYVSGWNLNSKTKILSKPRLGYFLQDSISNQPQLTRQEHFMNTNSVSIKHFKGPNDPSLNTHSTIQILKVLQPRHFGQNLNEVNKFLVPFDPRGYTYWDYIDAWNKVFWHQNNKFKHSWLIYFKTNTIYNFPNWFLQWWDFFGPILEIFPEQVQKGFAQFKKMYNSQESQIPVDLKYFLIRLKATSNSHHFSDMLLSSDGINLTHPRLNQSKLNFGSNPTQKVDPETSLFLNQKSQLAAFLASSSSKENLTKNLKEVLQLLQQNEEEGSSSKKEDTNSLEDDDVFYQNEDDCFGISLNYD
ncbi:hypothetical protein GmHk_06G017732 [Glycine max]|nr:hypothetical protein GmHk_06G017732 [Glycine max]